MATPGAARGLKIQETGFSLLKDIGGEEPGYGLYSYALAVNDDIRSAIFLSDVFSVIHPVEETGVRPSYLNILYIPLKNNVLDNFIGLLNVKGKKGEILSASSAYYAKHFYDYKMSRTLLLDNLCGSPPEEIKTECEGDLSRGPFIITYAQPASRLAPVEPPLLLVDLSDVHERAFPVIIAAFRAQVRREDFSDRAKIDKISNNLVSIVLTAADWVTPVQKAMADIVHVAIGQSENDKK